MGIVEVSGDSNNSLLHGSTQVGLSSLLHLGEHEGTDLRGRVMLAAGLNPGVTVGGTDDLVREMNHVLLSLFILESAANKTLSGVQSVLRILNGL